MGAVPSSAVSSIFRLLTSSIVRDENEFPSFAIVMFISRTRTVHLAPIMYLSGIANMFSLILCLVVVVSWLSIPCNALPGVLAPQTFGVEYGPPTAAWTPRPPPLVENVHRRDISPGAISFISISISTVSTSATLFTSISTVPTNTSTTAIATAVPSAAALRPAALSHAVTVGVVVIVTSLILVIALVLCCRCAPRRSNRRRKVNDQISFEPAPTLPVLKVSTSQVQLVSSVATFFALPDGRSRSDQALPPFKDDSMEYRFMALLALFGSNGVPLREFIMLASLRMSTKTSHNHWLIDGERGPLRQAIDAETTYEECSFLAAFTREASTIESIEIFQERLVSLGFINIEYQGISETLSLAQQCWFMDGRIWRINESSSYSSAFRPRLLLEVFWEVFADIPCKDISPLAERQREIYYYHAHQAMVHLYKNSSLPVEHPQNMKHFLLVILQVLSHRFQKHDEALLRLAKQYLPRSGLHADWNLVLLIAELKATISTKGKILSDISNRIFQAVENAGTRGNPSPRAKGLSGWLLVELLDTAEVLECTEIIDETVQNGKQWMQRLLGSELSSLEQIMICRAFARFGTSEDPEPLPRQYDLLFGYHLSRAGCTEKAEKLLFAGLEYYASSPMSTRIWSYRFEFVALILRSGRWSEAEAWLANARKSAESRSGVIHSSDHWKRSGECGELFILLGLYQADCDMAMGKLTSAEDCLKDTMEKTLFVRDYFIRALRLALRTRLLKVQMWQEVWARATVTAQDLIEDTIASGECLSTTRSSYSVGVIVLTLINKLLWISDVPAASRLLMSAKHFEDADYRVLPLDIELYLERRRAAVSHLLSIEGSSEYIRHLEDSGVDAEDAITFAPVVDQLDRNTHINPSGAQAPTSENPDIQATEVMLPHSGPNILKHSSGYKWSSELEHARFPTPEFEDFDNWEIRSNKTKSQDAGDIGGVQKAKRRAKKGRILRSGTRRGAVYPGNPLAEKLAHAPHPPTHVPRDPQLPTYHLPAELV